MASYRKIKKIQKRQLQKLEPRPVGRPEKPIDWNEVGRLAEIQCTAEEIGHVLKITRQTLSARCQSENQITLDEYITQHNKIGNASLRRLMWKCAEGEFLTSRTTKILKNGTQEIHETFGMPAAGMIIFMAKNQLGMKDVSSIEADVNSKSEVMVKHGDFPESTITDAITIMSKAGVFTISSN